MPGELQMTAAKIPSMNPATGEILGEIECASEGDVLAAVSRARAAQSAWHHVAGRRSE